MSISSIVAADDGSAHAVAALDMAINLAQKFDAELTVVHVYTHDHPPEELKHLVEVEHLAHTGRTDTASPTFSSLVGEGPAAKEQVAEARVIAVLAEQIIKNAAEKAKSAGITKLSTEVRSGDYANCILAVAEAKNADMIVMGRRGLSNLKGLLFGSVSQKVSQRADCSVLTVK